MHRQDLLPDSETLAVELRDGVTGVVRSRKTLVKGTDYRINYMQGVVILTTPLSSSSSASGVASSIADTQYLVVQYEFTPAASSGDDYALAGAAQSWINDHISIGATAVGEDVDGEKTTLLGANARLQADENSFIEAEVMRSEGTGSSSWVSLDGGLTFVEDSVAKRIDPAYAIRVAAETDLEGLGLDGRVGASVEKRQAGFAATGSSTKYDQLLVSTFADIAITESTTASATVDIADQGAQGYTRAYGAEVEHQLSPDLTLRGGINHIDIASTSQNGRRTDLGLGIAYVLNEDLEVSAYGRKTVDKVGTLTDADRVGVGIDYRINDALSLEGEVSYGSTGVGGLIGLVHQPTADERNYIGYRVNAPDSASLASSARTGLVVGTERKVNEIVALHSEAIYNTFDRNRTLTQTYGITLTPDEFWTLNGAFERGTIYDKNDEDLQRTALSLGAGYVSDGLTGTVRGEVRDEKSTTGAKDGQSYLFGSSMSWRTDDDWRLIGSFDALLSQYNNKAILDGDYVEASIGYAYRPVDNERFNALARYTFLYDLPGVQQVTANGSANGPAQRSHIFSIDGNYDINEWLTVGAKYGARIGEISENRDPSGWTRSSAHLGIIRVDAEVAKDWDILLEARAMALPEAKTLDLGALAAVYYSVDDHVKVGVGYNFAGFSDDLRDLERDHQGIFFNIMAKY
ncbi:outer membrane beta-barrel protein [Devosia sp. MC521]|uniref:outer membrane beta-barrel protein n=1 Tax=Devosia sp. MC521 TaxID=2759954 RepID=UPI0015FDEA70|nr:outer membrane beta-barrel protein [Devosia sp. MC521]MBJ6989064.1 hypothetical protein [Devosia sp. MC521]QMW62908.1 hypothetical protein H4N61_00625 [Devosia sp. MC521]